MQKFPASCCGVHDDFHIGWSAHRLAFRFFQPDVSMSLQQFQCRKNLLRFLEELSPAHLKKLWTLDHRYVLLFQLCQDKFSFLNAQVSTHHGIGVGGMSQKVFADLNRLAHRRSCYFCFVIFHNPLSFFVITNKKHTLNVYSMLNLLIIKNIHLCSQNLQISINKKTALCGLIILTLPLE